MLCVCLLKIQNDWYEIRINSVTKCINSSTNEKAEENKIENIVSRFEILCKIC